MADYKRLVSYIYAYPGGVRDKNVGFAKAEVRNGQFKLTVSVKGVYTDTPELFGVYVMVDGKKHQPGGFTLLKTGTVMVNQGIGQYQDLFNPMNINQSGYTFEDISGIALARENEDFYRMFSLWEDCILNTEDITFAQPEAAAASNPVVQADSEEVSVKEQENRTTGQEAERKSAEMSGNVRESETVRRNAEDVSENEVEDVVEAAVTSKPATPESAQSAGQQTDLQQETAQMKAQQVRAMEAVQELLFRNTNPQGTMPQNTKLQNAKPQEEMPAFEKVFINRQAAFPVSGPGESGFPPTAGSPYIPGIKNHSADQTASSKAPFRRSAGVGFIGKYVSFSCQKNSAVKSRQPEPAVL